jgi:hypothetical protein
MFRRLRLLESRVVGRIFGPNKDEVTGEWRRLHDEELYNMYSPSIIRGNQINNNEINRGYGTYGRSEMFVQGFGGKSLVKEATWKTQV